MRQTAQRRAPVIRFADYTLDLRAGELSSNRNKLRLQEQPLQILAALLEQPGQIVTREELQQRLWPDDTHVDFEHSLNAAIKRLREALQDSAEQPRFIETIPRRGYRFIAPVSGLEPATVPHRSGMWRYLAFAALATVLVAATMLGFNLGGVRDRLLGRPAPGEITSIAVLPLENLSGDPEQEYLADGMTEALITELGKVGALRVISRTSIMQYKERSKRLPEIAGELNVQAVVEGAVVRQGERIRINAQLLLANPERHLWAKSYERDARDIMALQAELAVEIARQIRVAVTPKERARLAATRPVNPEAHRAYLRGRYFWSKRSPEGMKRAVEYFQQAIDLDPAYAPAYAGLADAYGVRAGRYLGLTEKETLVRHKAMVEKALELDDSLAEAHASLGKLKEREWDWVGTEQEYRRAIELNPSYATPHHWLSVFLLNLGKQPEEGLRHAQRAVELDPLSPIINSHLCEAFVNVGEYERAIKQAHETLQLDEKNWQAHLCLSQVYLALGQDDKAAQHEEQNILLDSGPEAANQMRRRYEAEGWSGVWRWYLEEFNAQRARGEDIPWINVAECHAQLGELDKAMLALEKGYERRDPLFYSIVTYSPFRPLHSDPRFQDLVRRLNLASNVQP